jgi:hypothetical protein
LLGQWVLYCQTLVLVLVLVPLELFPNLGLE